MDETTNTTECNYYAVIPVKILSDNTTSSMARLLYGQISSLTNMDGFCWASNKYFADFFGISQRSVSRLVSELAEKEYIKVSIIRDEGTKAVEKRVITLGTTNLSIPHDKNDDRSHDKIVHPPHDKNGEENNKDIYTTNTDIKENISISKDIDIKRKSDICKQVIDYLNAKTQSHYKWQSHTKNIIARINEGYTLDDFKHVINVKTADWLNDEKMNRFLQPSTLFAKCHFDNYLNQKMKHTSSPATEQQQQDQMQRFLNS